MDPRIPFSIFVAIATCIACAGPLALDDLPTSGLNPAIIELEGAATVAVPDSAIVDQALTITVETWVGGSISHGETKVTLGERRIVIEPMDEFGSGNLDRWHRYPHETSVIPREKGVFEVVVVGRSMPGYREWSQTFNVEIR